MVLAIRKWVQKELKLAHVPIDDGRIKITKPILNLKESECV